MDDFKWFAEWYQGNKEWIKWVFSGVGVSGIGALLFRLFRPKSDSLSQSTTVNGDNNQSIQIDRAQSASVNIKKGS